MSAAPTSRPTFVIYRDEPPSPQKKKTVLASQPAVATVRLSIPTAGDKENLHPLTGLRPNSEVSISKKRKTGALATKKVVLLVKGLQSPPKKRKLSQSTAKSTADRKEKEGRGLSSRRHKTGSPSRVRKAPELPKVEEEAETEGQDEESQLMKNNMTQAAVDARCYELTVLPLADISKAYESCPLPESVHISEEESDVQQKKVCGLPLSLTTASNARLIRSYIQISVMSLLRRPLLPYPRMPHPLLQSPRPKT